MLRKRHKYPKIHPSVSMAAIYEDGICLEERKEGPETYCVEYAEVEDTHGICVGDGHQPVSHRKYSNYTIMLDIVMPFVRRILPNGI